MTTQEKLIEADLAYWNGENSGITDRDFDELSAAVGHISQPPATLKGWARYTDCELKKPNYGLKKVSWDVAKYAVKHWPKWDGIFIQGWFCHLVTRGNGKTGKNLAPAMPLLRFVFKPDAEPQNFELCYSMKDGGRSKLCADLSRGDLSMKAHLIPHMENEQDSPPPREIPQEIDGIPVDGWVIQLADGQKFAYKGEAL